MVPALQSLEERRSLGHACLLGAGVTLPCCTVPQCLVAVGLRISSNLQEPL